MNITAIMMGIVFYIQVTVESQTDYALTGNLLSFLIAGMAALVMWLAFRAISSERWIGYFGITFTALTGIYIVRYIPSESLSIFLGGALSLLSNIFGVAAALEILNRPLFRDPKERIKPTPSRRDRILSATCWVLTGLSVIAIVLRFFFSPEASDQIATRWGQDFVIALPDMIFSTLCLFLMGYAIFASVGSRQFRVVAPSAFLVGLLYGALQIVYGLIPYLSNKLQIPQGEIDVLMTWTGLPLKFLLFAFACHLVFRFFEILTELGAMQEAEFETRLDYLASEGIVAWIARRLSDKAFKDWTTGRYSEAPGESGFVNLVIRLPGDADKRVACIIWPNAEEDKRPTILDWIPETKQFSPLSTEVEPKRAKLWTWEEFLPLVHDTLSSPKSSVDSKNEVKRTYRGNVRAIITLPISVNDAAIGCLQIARSDPHLNRFSQMARRHLVQITKLLAPSVQSYRELAGLDLMSIIFAKKLAEEAPYSPEKSIESIIIKLLHDIFAPTVTRLSVDFGFSSPRIYWETTNDVGHVKDVIEEEVANKEFEVYPPAVSSRVFPKEYQVLKKRLTTRVGQNFGARREEKDEFILGDLVFAVDAAEDAYTRPALGVNYLHRKTACTLAAAAYLDFSRDYFSHVLKTLGKELSAKRLSLEDWFNPIRTVLTRDANLSWVVVRQRRERNWFGDPQGLRALERMKNVKHKVKTRTIRGSHEIRRQYYFSDPESNTNNILKLRLDASEAIIWIGISRPGFGKELDFPSPWKTFLVNFAQIADASLSRITIPEKFKEHLEAAQLQGIIASVATTGTMTHQLSNLIASQQNSIKALRTAFAFGQIKANGTDYEDILRAMDEESTGVLQLIESVITLTTTDDERPCRLGEVARHAFMLYEVSLIARDIQRVTNIAENIWIDVPFRVAALALATLVGNSKDAIANKGSIRIDGWEEGETVVCRVTDTGEGISGETRKVIFEPKPVTKAYGTGMGLYLTRHSLSEYDSSIQLTESHEKGSTFTIHFPKAKEDNLNE